jgi:hypothetical protein
LWSYQRITASAYLRLLNKPVADFKGIANQAVGCVFEYDVAQALDRLDILLGRRISATGFKGKPNKNVRKIPDFADSG